MRIKFKPGFTRRGLLALKVPSFVAPAGHDVALSSPQKRFLLNPHWNLDSTKKKRELATETIDQTLNDKLTDVTHAGLFKSPTVILATTVAAQVIRRLARETFNTTC